MTERMGKYQYLVFVGLDCLTTVRFRSATGSSDRVSTVSVPSKIFKASIVGLKVYATMYSLSMAILDIVTGQFISNDPELCQNLSASLIEASDTPPTKATLRRKEIMRFQDKDGDIPCIWQAAGGYLMSNEKMIGDEFEERLDMSNRSEEEQYLGTKDFFPVKYELSDCRQYLVGCG
jgi:hypothetical protein